MLANHVKIKETCRVIVIGSNKARLNKILPLILAKTNSEHTSFNCNLEFLPCVASFSSYQDASRKNVRYLERIEYFPLDCDGMLALTPSSLLPFFDNDSGATSILPSISGVAVGCGIEGSDDTERIENFIRTIVAQATSGRHGTPIVRTIEPNPGYASMVEELAAYKQLSAIEKEKANLLGTMGPEKMVKFVVEFSDYLIREAWGRAQAQVNAQNDDQALTSATLYGGVANQELFLSLPRTFDPTEDCFLCRMCRTTLFGDRDLQDPPHESSRHRFSHRKVHHGSIGAYSLDCCQSYFLQDCLEWMGSDIRNGVAEGKLNCPKCDAKVGAWIWSGAQCSCGTWVVPAIQIPKSKVDVLVALKHD